MLFHRGCFINVRHSTNKITNVPFKNSTGVKLQGKNLIHVVGFYDIYSPIRGHPILSLSTLFNLPPCSFIQWYIHLRMMTYSVICRDKIHTHLSSSCIISSYFWMTLAPSADSRHLQRRWNFTAHAKVISNIFPVANTPKHNFYEAFKTVQRAINSHWDRWKRMTTPKFIF